MSKTKTTQATIGSKKAAEPQVVNAVASEKIEKRTNFDLVAVGVCPHDDDKLGDETRGRGVGVTRVCEKCGHTWYINKKIRTCKCLTCSGARRKSAERVVNNRQVQSIAKNNSGPFWTRTRDLSLIRIDNERKNVSSGTPLPDYIDPWYNEQLLKGLTKSTADCHRSHINALLSVYPRPTELDIKNYLYQKQQAGYMSGTIANYVKSYRSFFGYLLTNGLYDLDYQRLKIPKIKYRERRVPTDKEVKKLFQAVDRDEDRLALLLLVDCGIRVTELATIKIQNINLEDVSILINGKGNKVRTVYLSDQSVRFLRGYISKLNSEYLFPASRSDANNGYRNRRFFEIRLAELCERARIEQITPHQLRHYFATHTLSNGADVKAVSEMLGHADVGITLKIYHHVNARAIREMHSEFSPIVELVAVS